MQPVPRAPRKRWWGDPMRPPSGAIPRFPVWEVTIMAFMAVYGVAGIANLRGLSPEVADGRVPPPPGSAAPGLVVAAVGPEWATVWYISLIVAFVIGVIGLLRPAPDGLIITMGSMLILMVAAGSVSIGLVIDRDRLFFPGITTLYIFFVGSLFRAIQCFSQLRTIARRVERLASAVKTETV